MGTINDLLGDSQRVLIIDGGLATELEARGFDINDPLWSARILIENPDAIRQVHDDYLTAGADCVITASYQASSAGLAKTGVEPARAAQLWQRSIQLACQARDDFWHGESRDPRRIRPLVAASIGPYGAYLHDGSEYRGGYGLSREELAAFHRDRFDLLATSQADLLACETIPCLIEAEVLLDLLKQHPQAEAWFAFSCQSGQLISHGEPITQCTALLDAEKQVAAVGVNCTAPRFVESLVREMRSVTDKPIVVYPNSGETWVAGQHTWTGKATTDEFAELAESWRAAGANLIGGCCRTGPAHIRRLSQSLRGYV